MKLQIPAQITPAESATPNQPRKLKKILATLPNANMGELTKQLYQILRELNRQTMPAKYRLENMEMLRKPCREVFKNLKKYFISRSLPLPDKSRKVVNLNQLLLQEMAYGYKILLADVEKNGKSSKINKKSQAIACCRTISYLAELLLRSSEIYATPAKNLWRDVHQVYLFAESHHLLEVSVNDNEIKADKKIAINVNLCYKQILLFTLARPIALSQSDSERVFQKLPHWVKYCTIQHQAVTAQVDKIFCLKIDEDAAPDYLSKEDLDTNTTKRFLDATQLVAHIKESINLPENNPSKLTLGDEISPDSLKIVCTNWGTSTKRRFSRANRQGKIEVSIGLKIIAHMIFEKNKKTKGVDTRSGIVRTEQATTSDFGFTLEAIADDNEVPNLSGYVTHTEIDDSQNNSWDMVARGTVLTDTYDKEQRKLTKEGLNQHKKQADTRWAVVNISAGGYCLRWNSEDASHAQIGEVIALYEQVNNDKFEWRIGIIRWMQFTQKNGLEIGVQVISPQVISAVVQRANRPNEKPFECLLLPGVKPLKQPSSIILPAHAFKANDKLTVDIMTRKLPVTLGLSKEHTGLFTQFYYTNTEEASRIQKQAKKAQASKTQDDFDEIWSSL